MRSSLATIDSMMGFPQPSGSIALGWFLLAEALIVLLSLSRVQDEKSQLKNWTARNIEDVVA